MKKLLPILLASLVLVGCATTPTPVENPLAAFHETKPRSILVLPVVNNSVDVLASTSVLSTLPRILGERGFYVFPVNTVKTLLEYEGLGDPQEIHDKPTKDLAALFGAESVLYVTVHSWTAEYVLISTTTVVDLEYVIKDAEGNVIFQDRQVESYTPESENTGDFWSNVIASAITAAIERAAPNYLPLTRQANSKTFLLGRYPLPPGPYSPDYSVYYEQK